jgi:hypothetical protein
MRLRLLSYFAVCGSLACASSGQSSPGSDDGEQITIVVANEFNMAVTAYAVWEGTRVRLGDVSSGRTRTFATGRRSNQVAVGLEVTGFSRGTSAGPSRFGGGDPDPSARYVQSEPIDIDAEDGIAWTLASSGVLVYRRLSSDPSSATPAPG